MNLRGDRRAQTLADARLPVTRRPGKPVNWHSKKNGVSSEPTPYFDRHVLKREEWVLAEAPVDLNADEARPVLRFRDYRSIIDCGGPSRSGN